MNIYSDKDGNNVIVVRTIDVDNIYPHRFNREEGYDDFISEKFATFDTISEAYDYIEKELDGFDVPPFATMEETWELDSIDTVLAGDVEQFRFNDRNRRNHFKEFNIVKTEPDKEGYVNLFMSVNIAEERELFRKMFKIDTYEEALRRMSESISKFTLHCKCKIAAKPLENGMRVLAYNRKETNTYKVVRVKVDN